MVINKKYIGAAILTILLPILAASENSLKSLVDEWFDTCSVIVDTGELESSSEKWFYPVKLYVQGNPPNEASLVISSNRRMFKSLEYIHDLNSINRSLHPNVPLKIYDELQTNMSVELKPFRSRLLYSFRAFLDEEQLKVNRDDILVAAFVQFPDESIEATCRVETNTWFNLAVGKSSWGRFLFMLVLVMTLSIAVALLREK